MQTGWARYQQLVNAAKYVSALGVVISSTFVPNSFKADRASVIWLLLLMVKTVFTFAWDIRMDWGLCRRGASYVFLRPTLSFPPAVYYVAIVFNLFMRASGSFAISQNICQQSCSLTLGLCEILRRGMWTVLRVEHQALRGSTTVDVVLYQAPSAGSSASVFPLQGAAALAEPLLSASDANHDL